MKTSTISSFKTFPFLTGIVFFSIICISSKTQAQWSVLGNGGTNPPTNFLGTTDSKSLYIKINNTQAGWLDATGTTCTSWGLNALVNNTTGTYNVGLGYLNLSSVTIGSDNTGVGSFSLDNALGSDNTAVGWGAVGSGSNSESGNNVGIGYAACGSLSTGDSNTGVGSSALRFTTTGKQNTATGAYSLIGNSSGSYNTAQGYGANHSNTTGNYNTALGFLALGKNSDAGENTAIGGWSSNNNNGNDNVSIGYQSLDTATNANNSVAIGYQSLYLNKTGYGNTMVGMLSGAYMINASANTAIGFEAMSGGFLTSKQTGDSNTAGGFICMDDITTGGQNAAWGAYSMYSDTSGSDNTAEGFSSLRSCKTGGNNVAVGWNVLEGNDANANTAIGSDAMFLTTTGSYCTSVGYFSGVHGNYINANAFGYNVQFLGTNTTAIADSLNVLTATYGQVRTSMPSTNPTSGAGFILPIQVSTATSGTVSSNGAQVLELTGVSGVNTLTITEPTSPQVGQQFEITTSQSSVNIAFTHTSNFYNSALPARIGAAVGLRFIFDGTKLLSCY